MKKYDHKISNFFSQFEISFWAIRFLKTPYFFITLKDRKSHNKLIQLPGSFKLNVR